MGAETTTPLFTNLVVRGPEFSTAFLFINQKHFTKLHLGTEIRPATRTIGKIFKQKEMCSSFHKFWYMNCKIVHLKD